MRWTRTMIATAAPGSSMRPWTASLKVLATFVAGRHALGGATDTGVAATAAPRSELSLPNRELNALSPRPAGDAASSHRDTAALASPRSWPWPFP